MSKGIGELHAEFDEAIERYMIFNNGWYDSAEHVGRTQAVIVAGERLLEAFERAANSESPRRPWILRHR